MYLTGIWLITRETSLEKYKGNQIVQINHDDFFIGDNVHIKTNERVKLVLVYEIAIKDYKVGDIIK